MEEIFHEQQDGLLCAQHCLNALVQDSVFSANELAEIAKQLDEEERARMAEAGVNTTEYQRFLKQPSSNYDDSGYFSIQVLQKAVEVFQLSLMPLNHPDELAKRTKHNPTSQKAFICNFNHHWLTIRKLGNQWFNLNSLKSGPELLSDTYLEVLLKQLENDGYSIFIVLGKLPDCRADALLRLKPAVQPVKPKDIFNVSEQESETDLAMEEAMRASRLEHEVADQSLQQALQRSINEGAGNMNDYPSCSFDATQIQVPSGGSKVLTADELRQKRLAALQKSSDPQPPAATRTVTQSAEDEFEEAQLKKALEMSLQS